MKTGGNLFLWNRGSIHRRKLAGRVIALILQDLGITFKLPLGRGGGRGLDVLSCKKPDGNYFGDRPLILAKIIAHVSSDLKTRVIKCLQI